MKQEIQGWSVPCASSNALVFSILIHLAWRPSTGECFRIKCRLNEQRADGIKASQFFSHDAVALRKGMIP
jgi:hypothetical protein